MGLRDISKEIADVSQGYHFTQTPEIVQDLREWAAKLIRQVLEWFRDLMHHDSSSLDTHALSDLFQVLIWLALAVGLGLMVWTLIKRARADNKSGLDKTRGASEVEELLDAAGWRNQAKRLAGGSDYKGACRALYLSLLQNLHENGIAEFAPAKTNYEYGYSLSKHPAIKQDFMRLAERVEHIWFGNRPATGDDYNQSLDEIAGMERQIGSVSAAKTKAEASDK